MSALGQQNPIDHPDLWDFVTVSGVRSPGVLKDGDIGEWKREHTWDEKKGKGTVGSTITFVNKPAAKGSITLMLGYDDGVRDPRQDFADLDAFLPMLEYDPTKQTVSAVDIYHPTLDALGISSVVTTGIGPVRHEGKQLYSITIDFLEYLPPPAQSAVSTPTGATGNPPPPGNTGNPPQTPLSAEEKTIQALLKQAQAA